jgi:hypothetical protein
MLARCWLNHLVRAHILAEFSLNDESYVGVTVHMRCDICCVCVCASSRGATPGHHVLPQAAKGGPEALMLRCGIYCLSIEKKIAVQKKF